MTWGAVATIGGAVIGAAASSSAADQQSKAARDAASASALASRNASDAQQYIYDQTRKDQTPWRNTGGAALNQLAMMMGLTPDQVAAGGGGSVTNAYTPNDLLIGPEMRANPELYAKDPEYRKAYDAFAHRIDYVTAGGSLSDPRRYEKYAGGLASEFKNAVNLSDINGRMAALAEQDRAKLPDFTKDPRFGSLARNFSMQDFEQDPGYAFRQAEGQKAIERSAAARGGLLSGAAMKGIERFGQGLASEEYQNAFNRFQSNQNNQFNRFASLAGVGQTANNALQTAGSNYANAIGQIGMNNAANQGNSLMAQGNARASGYLGAGNAFANTFANWPQQQQQPAGYQVPQGYAMGSGYAGNAYATSQGYQPLNHAAANAGYYD